MKSKSQQHVAASKAKRPSQYRDPHTGKVYTVDFDSLTIVQSRDGVKTGEAKHEGLQSLLHWLAMMKFLPQGARAHLPAFAKAALVAAA
jgi:hypothetical protein